MTIRKVRRSISFDKDLIHLIDKFVLEDYHIKDRSHFVEVASKELLERAGFCEDYDKETK